MSGYTARAVRWEHGWELHVDGVGVTQVRVLEHAVQQVRDLVETMTGEPADDADVILTLDVDDLGDRAAAARALTAEATAKQAEAAAATRAVVRDLRSAGLSVSDIGTVLGVSRGRVSQLLADTPEPTVTVTYHPGPRAKATAGR